MKFIVENYYKQMLQRDKRYKEIISELQAEAVKVEDKIKIIKRRLRASDPYNTTMRRKLRFWQSKYKHLEQQIQKYQDLLNSGTAGENLWQTKNWKADLGTTIGKTPGKNPIQYTDIKGDPTDILDPEYDTAADDIAYHLKNHYNEMLIRESKEDILAKLRAKAKDPNLSIEEASKLDKQITAIVKGERYED